MVTRALYQAAKLNIRSPTSLFQRYAIRMKIQNSKSSLTRPLQHLKDRTVNFLANAQLRSRLQAPQLHSITGTSHLIKKRGKLNQTSSKGRSAKKTAFLQNMNNFEPVLEYAFSYQKYHKIGEVRKHLWPPVSGRSSGPEDKGQHIPRRRGLEDIAGRPKLYCPPGLFGGDSKYADPFFVPEPIINAHLIENASRKEACRLFEATPESETTDQVGANRGDPMDDPMDVCNEVAEEIIGEEMMIDAPMEATCNLDNLCSSPSASRNVASLAASAQAQPSLEATLPDHKISDIGARGLPGLGMFPDESHPKQQPSIPIISPASKPKPCPSTPVSRSIRRDGLVEYRDPALVATSFKWRGNDPISSVPSLSDELSEQDYAPILSSASDQTKIDALCQCIAALSLDDVPTLKRPIAGLHARVPARYTHENPDEHSPSHACSKRKIPDDPWLYPAGKRICLAAQSGSSADGSAPKTRHLTGVHRSVLAYQDVKLGGESPACSSSKVGTPDRAQKLDNHFALRPADSDRCVPGVEFPTTKFVQSEEPGSFGVSQPKGNTIIASSVGSPQSVPRASLSTTFVQSQKPGSFDLSNIKDNTILSSSVGFHQSVPRASLSTTFVQSKKPGPSDVSKPKGNTIVSSSVGSHQSVLRASQSTTFVQSKKPGSFDVSKPKGNAIVSPSVGSHQSVPRASLSTTFVHSKKTGSFGVSNAQVNAVPVAPVFVTSKAPNSPKHRYELQNTASQRLTQFSASHPRLNNNGNAGTKPPDVFKFSKVPEPVTSSERANQGNHATRRAGQPSVRRAMQTPRAESIKRVTSRVPPLQTSGTCTTVCEAKHVNRTRNGFRERTASSRKELEVLLPTVPEPYQIKTHEVIESPLCDKVPTRSDDKVSSIPDLAKKGPGASVTPVHRVQKYLSKIEIHRDLEFFRKLRQEFPEVWFALITFFLQSGCTPYDILGDNCNEVLGDEWVIDFERLDRASSGDSTTNSGAFFARADIPMALRPIFDQAQSKIFSGGCQVFEMAVKQWAEDRNAKGNKALFLQCLRRAGWIEAQSEYAEFMRWSIEFPPDAIRKACLNHFKWAFPRLLHAVSSERIRKMGDLVH